MATYDLVCDTTSYSLSGQTANLEYNRLFDCGTRDFYAVGKSASLLYHRRTSLSQVAYNIAGYNTTLDLERQRLYAGSVTIVGNPANLEYNRKPALDGGSYNLSGTDANLVYAKGLLTPAAGPMDLTGQDANLRYLLLYSLSLTPGAISLTGQELLPDYYEHLLSTGIAEFIITTYAN